MYLALFHLIAEPVSHSSIFVEIISLVAAIVGTAAGGIATWYGVRRKTSGRIGTSDADILWQQSSFMRESLQAQLDKATEQRDRLIDSQASQVMPLMAGVTESIGQIGASIARLLQVAAENHEMLTNLKEEIGHEKILQIQGTAREGARPDPPASESQGSGDRPTDSPGI